MNLLLRIVLIAILVSIGQMFLPWYCIVPIAFLVEFTLGEHDATKFFSGFYGIAIPWLALSAYIDVKSESILSVRILELFNLPRYGFVLVLITGLLGGLVGGFSSMVGGWLKEAVKHD